MQRKARVSWVMVELFGLTHIKMPQENATACKATLNPNIEKITINNISKHITCPDCLKFARIMRIPTA